MSASAGRSALRSSQRQNQSHETTVVARSAAKRCELTPLPCTRHTSLGLSGVHQSVGHRHSNERTSHSTVQMSVGRTTGIDGGGRQSGDKISKETKRTCCDGGGSVICGPGWHTCERDHEDGRAWATFFTFTTFCWSYRVSNFVAGKFQSCKSKVANTKWAVRKPKKSIQDSSGS